MKHVPTVVVRRPRPRSDSDAPTVHDFEVADTLPPIGLHLEIGEPAEPPSWLLLGLACAVVLSLCLLAIS